MDAYRDDIDFIRKPLREELELMLKPQVNRIAKLIMRIGMMTISMCYFTSKIIFQFVPFRNKVIYEEMMSESKRKTTVYSSEVIHWKPHSTSLMKTIESSTQRITTKNNDQYDFVANREQEIPTTTIK